MLPAPEFSRPVAIESLAPDKPRTEAFEATEAECAALAGRFDLQSLPFLKAKITTLRISEGNIIRVEGDIEAEVVQTCVVSLQSVPALIKAHFDTSFTEDGKEAFDLEDIEPEMEIEDDPATEVIRNGTLDLGELVAQYLSLELDPYPRAPGVSLAAQLTESGENKKNRPFEVLQELKKKKDE